jgi:hypothetical protein
MSKTREDKAPVRFQEAPVIRPKGDKAPVRFPYFFAPIRADAPDGLITGSGWRWVKLRPVSSDVKRLAGRSQGRQVSDGVS